MFRDSKVSTVLQDLSPALLITLYSIWEVITRRYLLALQVSVVPLKSGEREGVDIMNRQSLWFQDMQVKAFTADHRIVSLLAVAGLSIWSVGVPFATYLVCLLRCRKLQEFETKRLLGFFYVGLEPHFVGAMY